MKCFECSIFYPLNDPHLQEMTLQFFDLVETGVQGDSIGRRDGIHLCRVCRQEWNCNVVPRISWEYMNEGRLEELASLYDLTKTLEVPEKTRLLVRRRTIDTYEKAGRLDDLASFYDKEGLPEKARETRSRKRQNAIDYFEKTGRLEDLAVFYEREGSLEKAGQTRLRLRRQVITTVSVDLNSLISDIRLNGMCVPLKCRSCGASIQVSGETNPDGIRKCKFCGSEMDVQFLRNIVDCHGQMKITQNRHSNSPHPI